MEHTIYWGDLHAQFNLNEFRRRLREKSHGPSRGKLNVECERFVRRSFESARTYLDFFPIVYYPAYFYATPQGLETETVGMKESFQDDWGLICRLVQEYHQPGIFVTFPGYEWTGDRTRWGDHNVFYPYDHPVLDLSLTIDDLYRNLKQRQAITVPHHTAYAPENRSKDWDHFDEELSPFAEIYSVHGSSEGCDTPYPMVRNGSMGPRVSGNSIQDGLARGYRLGIIASGDNGGGFAGKWGIGLAAVLASDLSRESIWEAFLERRVYGVTGDRIKVDFSIGGALMGSVVPYRTPISLQMSVEGTTALDRIEILRNNRVVYTHCHNGTWDSPKEGRTRGKVAFEFGWGPSERYGLGTAPRRWKGKFECPGLKVLSVEGRFTLHENRVTRISDHQYAFELHTEPRIGSVTDTSQQALVFEVEGDVGEEMMLECEGVQMSTSLKQAFRETDLAVLLDEGKARIKEQFDLEAGDFENSADVYYHNSYKIKRHRAVPVEGYTVSLEWEDQTVSRGWNWYYLRVSQLNGQYAWSSPIWVDGSTE